MYFAHIAFEIYDNLKSFQTAMSFQAGSSLSLADFFDFFRHHKKKTCNLYVTNKLSISK